MAQTKFPDPIFVNTVGVRGFANGVVNVAFVTTKFVPAVLLDPGQDGVMSIDEVSADLRMDLYCAQQLRAALDEVIEQNTQPRRADA